MKKLTIILVISVMLNPAFIFANGMKEDEELLADFLSHNVGVSPLNQKYVFDKIYVGMEEKEFVKIYTKDETFDDTYKPYITKKDKNIYYLHLPYIKLWKKLLSKTRKPNITNTGTARVIFINGKLAKYEIQYRDKFPFMFLVYGDRTYLLQGERTRSLRGDRLDKG